MSQFVLRRNGLKLCNKRREFVFIFDSCQVCKHRSFFAFSGAIITGKLGKANQYFIQSAGNNLFFTLGTIIVQGSIQLSQDLIYYKRPSVLLCRLTRKLAASPLTYVASLSLFRCTSFRTLVLHKPGIHTVDTRPGFW